MDSQTALNIVANLISQRQSELTALDIARDLITNGFASDSARIDTEVQKGRDAVAAELASIPGLQAQVIALTDELNAAEATPNTL